MKEKDNIKEKMLNLLNKNFSSLLVFLETTSKKKDLILQTYSKLSDLPISQPVEIFDICEIGLVIISIKAGLNLANPMIEKNLNDNNVKLQPIKKNKRNTLESIWPIFFFF